MVNEWMSALPSAFRAQDPNTQVNAAKTGAETAAQGAAAALTAVQAADQNQARIRKQALQDVMAKGIRTKLGPDGKLIHVFDQDRFLEALAKSPAAADAYKEYASAYYPQMAKDEVQRGLSGAITPEGGLDAGKLAATAQRSPVGAAMLDAAAEQQKQRLAGAAEQAGNLTGIGTLVTSPAGAAAPGTLVGNQQMQPRPLDAAAAGTVTPDQVGKLSPTTRKAAILNLRAAGVAIPDHASSADIANAANAFAGAQVQAGLGEIKSFGDLPASVFRVRQAAPKTTQEALGKIFGSELEVQGKQISNRRAGIETEGIAGGVAKTEDLASKLYIPKAAIGNNASPEMQMRIDHADDAVNALGELKTNMRGIVGAIDSGELNPDTPEGSKKLVADLVAQLGVINRIYGTSGTEGGVERALVDLGAPPDLAKAIQENGVRAAKTWVSSKTIDWRKLLAGAPERAAQSVVGALNQAKSADPYRVLRNAGHGDIAPKRLAPSVFGDQKAPASSGPQLGEIRAKSGVKAKWNGRSWERIQ